MPETKYEKNYEQLKDMPADVLASRLVHSLIMQKGDLSKYKNVLEHFIKEVRKEYEQEQIQ